MYILPYLYPKLRFRFAFSLSVQLFMFWETPGDAPDNLETRQDTGRDWETVRDNKRKSREPCNATNRRTVGGVNVNRL